MLQQRQIRIFQQEIWKFQLAVVLELIEISYPFPPKSVLWETVYVFQKSWKCFIAQNWKLIFLVWSVQKIPTQNNPSPQHFSQNMFAAVQTALCVQQKCSFDDDWKCVSLAGSHNHNMKCLLVTYSSWVEVGGAVSLTHSQHAPGSPRNRFIELKARRSHQII